MRRVNVSAEEGLRDRQGMSQEEAVTNTCSWHFAIYSGLDWEPVKNRLHTITFIVLFWLRLETNEEFEEEVAHDHICLLWFQKSVLPRVQNFLQSTENVEGSLVLFITTTAICQGHGSCSTVTTEAVALLQWKCVCVCMRVRVSIYNTLCKLFW